MNERVIVPLPLGCGDGLATPAGGDEPAGPGWDPRHRAARLVLVADGDPIARRGVRVVLHPAYGFLLVGDAGSAHEAIRLAAERQPELVVMSACLPDGDCIAPIQQITSRVAHARVVILTSEPDDELALRALRAGACGCLPKTIDAPSLRRALRHVLDGDVAVSRALATRLVEVLRRQPEAWRPVRSRLTTREWEIVELLAAGASTQAIAERLFISQSTVYTHVNRVLHKLGVHTRAEAVVAARRLRDQEAAADA